jgi:hyaluronan synthase
MLVAALIASVGVFLAVLGGYLFQLVLLDFYVGSFTLYAVVALYHYVDQMRFAHLETNRWSIKPEYRPRVGIMVTGYKEDPYYFRRCLESILTQTYTNVGLVVFTEDEDDPNGPMGRIFREVAQERKNWVHVQTPHSHKRSAMYSGLAAFGDDIKLLCFTDSDTILHPQAVEWIIQPFADPEEKVGCATGYVSVFNKNQNIQTMMINFRYWLAFNLERQAQSHHGVVTCVSGPWGCYPRELIEKIKDAWFTQMFVSRLCTVGEDRRFTNMILGLEYKSVFVPQATVETEAPPKLWTLIKQQTRWSRSFFREYALGTTSFHHHHWWLAFDLTYQAIFPFFVAANVGIIIHNAVINDNPIRLLAWLGVVLFFGFIRAAYGAIKMRDPAFLLFSFYGFFVIGAMIPVKVFALFTPWRTGWGTPPRSLQQTEEER